MILKSLLDKFLTKTFLKFLLIGGSVFLVDAGGVTLLVKKYGFDLIMGRVYSFTLGITLGWYLHRTYTFSVASKKSLTEWRRYVYLNIGGACINWGIYLSIVHYLEIVKIYPFIAVAGASGGSMLFSYLALSWLFSKS